MECFLLSRKFNINREATTITARAKVQGDEGSKHDIINSTYGADASVVVQ